MPAKSETLLDDNTVDYSMEPSQGSPTVKSENGPKKKNKQLKLTEDKNKSEATLPNVSTLRSKIKFTKLHKIGTAEIIEIIIID